MMNFSFIHVRHFNKATLWHTISLLYLVNKRSLVATQTLEVDLFNTHFTPVPIGLMLLPLGHSIPSSLKFGIGSQLYMLHTGLAKYCLVWMNSIPIHKGPLSECNCRCPILTSQVHPHHYDITCTYMVPCIQHMNSPNNLQKPCIPCTLFIPIITIIPVSIFHSILYLSSVRLIEVYIEVYI